MLMDEQEMAEEVGRLRQVESDLRKQLEAAERAAKYARAAGWCRSILGTLTFCIILLAGVGGLGAVLYMTATTPAKATHCIIERATTCSFKLVGVVPWGSNIDYGFFDTFDTAVTKANSIKCRVEVSP